MSEGARANSIWLTCPIGHVKQWHARAVQNGAAKWCTAAGTCGRPLRRLTDDENATMIIGGPDAVTHLVERKFQIAQDMEIVTRPDGMELWVCANGHITPFVPTAPGKWICCPRPLKKDAPAYTEACGLPIIPATQAQVDAHDAAGRMCGPEAAALAAAIPEDP